MADVGVLVDAAAQLGLTVVQPSAPARPIGPVVTADAWATVAAARRDALVVVLASLATSARAYELDVAVRAAIGHGVAAMILLGPSVVPVTAREVAARGRLAVLTGPRDLDVAALLLDLRRVLGRDDARVLADARYLVDSLQALEDAGDVDAVLAHAGAVLGCRVEFRAASGPDADGATPITLRGTTVGHLVVEPVTESAHLTRHAVGAAITRMLERRAVRQFAPVQTRGELVAALLICGTEQLPDLLRRAREINLTVDQEHTAICLRPRPGPDRSVTARSVLQHMELVALQELPQRTARWHVAREPDGIIVVRSQPVRTPELSAQVAADARRMLAGVTAAVNHGVVGGVGTTHRGIDGLRRSAAEARSAADLASGSGRTDALVCYDASGLRRLLLDLTAAPLGRRAVAECLAPLDELDPARRRQAVRTLSVFLDTQCSPTRAGAILCLHPNAVTYRIRRITDKLRLDLTDPDARLMAHIACRTELLAE